MHANTSETSELGHRKTGMRPVLLLAHITLPDHPRRDIGQPRLDDEVKDIKKPQTPLTSCRCDSCTTDVWVDITQSGQKSKSQPETHRNLGKGELAGKFWNVKIHREEGYWKGTRRREREEDRKTVTQRVEG